MWLRSAWSMSLLSGMWRPKVTARTIPYSTSAATVQRAAIPGPWRRCRTAASAVSTSAAVKVIWNVGLSLNRCIVATNVRSSASARLGMTAAENV